MLTCIQGGYEVADAISVQLTAKHQVATPVNWSTGQLAARRGRDHRAFGLGRGRQAKLPGGWKAPKPYIRFVPQPRS